jgi:hypothetical protein
MAPAPQPSGALLTLISQPQAVEADFARQQFTAAVTNWWRSHRSACPEDGTRHGFRARVRASLRRRCCEELLSE